MTTSYTATNQVAMNALPTANGIIQKFLANATNSGAATFAPDGLAAAPIFGLGGQALQGNEIVANGIATVISYIGPLLNSGALCWVLIDCVGGAQQVAAATQSNHAMQLGQATAQFAPVASAVLPGTVIDWASNIVPAGYLACPTTQTNVSRTTYPALFAAIGTTWGAGDGSTTFGLPWFAADYATLQSNGSNVGTTSIGQVISHSHNWGQNLWNATSTGTGMPAGGYGDWATTATGGAANLAAGVRMRKIIKY